VAKSADVVSMSPEVSYNLAASCLQCPATYCVFASPTCIIINSLQCTEFDWMLGKHLWVMYLEMGEAAFHNIHDIMRVNSNI